MCEGIEKELEGIDLESYSVGYARRARMLFSSVRSHVSSHLIFKSF